VNWNSSRPKRAGIILYDDNYYYLAIDTKTGDITDCGGKVIYPHEDAITGAIREFNEETLFVFPKIEWMDLYNSDVLIDDDIVIFLLKINYNVHDYKQKFLEKKSVSLYTEISNIIRINKDGKNKELYKDKIYPLIKNCMSLILED